MALTDAKRRANDKFDREYRTVVACKLYKDKAAAFREACAAAGTTRNAVLTAAVEAFMAEQGGWERWLAVAAADGTDGSDDVMTE